MRGSPASDENALRTLYFAYGSNMSTERLRARLRSAQAFGAARLRGKRWICNKRGRDGSAKANLVDDPRGLVWGVLWQIDPADWDRLDRFELGYLRIEVRVETRDGQLHHAGSYASEQLLEDPLPSASYQRWLLAGAREHGLPRSWVANLEQLPVRPDPGRA